MLLTVLLVSPVSAHSCGDSLTPSDAGQLQSLVYQQADPPTSGSNDTQVPPTSSGATSPTSTPAADGKISHTVQSGEVLITIAQNYGVRLDELMALNNLTADSILQIGQVLFIKQAEAPMAALTTGTVIAATATLRPSLTPKPTLTPFLTATPTPTEEPVPGIITRVFTGNAKYIGLAILGLLVLGIVLLVISSRRIH